VSFNDFKPILIQAVIEAKLVHHNTSDLTETRDSQVSFKLLSYILNRKFVLPLLKRTVNKASSKDFKQRWIRYTQQALKTENQDGIRITNEGQKQLVLLRDNLVLRALKISGVTTAKRLGTNVFNPCS